MKYNNSILFDQTWQIVRKSWAFDPLKRNIKHFTVHGYLYKVYRYIGMWIFTFHYRYRAPECLLTDGYYTYKMDMWSVGCVFFEILSLHPLFPGSNEVDQIAKIHDIMGTPDPSVLNKFKK